MRRPCHFFSMTSTDQNLTYGKIFRFWIPMLATWMMMAVEGPFLAAVIARLAEPKANLAAYGVAYAFALVAESPIIMLMSASTALAKDREIYRRLRTFTLVLNLLVTAALSLLVLPPVFRAVAEGLIGLTPEVASQTHLALLLLLPWPAAIGFRRFYQGVLIRQHRTRRVATATVMRVVIMAVSALAVSALSSLPGAAVGALALSAGVVAEALMTRFMAAEAVKSILARPPEKEQEVPGFGDITRFYLPLALTPFIGLSVHPVVTFFLGQSRQAVDSLAVMPVIYALSFVFRAVGLSFQEVGLALLGEAPEEYRKIRNFAAVIGGAATGILALIAFTPLAGFWFGKVSGLSSDLTAFATIPLRIMAILPALTVLIGFQRSVLMREKVTSPISIATAIEAVFIFLSLFLLIRYSPFSGATMAAMSYIIGRLLAIAYLVPPFARCRGRLPAPVLSDPSASVQM